MKGLLDYPLPDGWDIDWTDSQGYIFAYANDDMTFYLVDIDVNDDFVRSTPISEQFKEWKEEGFVFLTREEYKKLCQ